MCAWLRFRVPTLLGEPYPVPPPLLLQSVPLALPLAVPLLRCELKAALASLRQPWHACGSAGPLPLLLLLLLLLLLRLRVGEVDLLIYLRRLLLRELLRPLLRVLHLRRL